MFRVMFNAEVRMSLKVTVNRETIPNAYLGCRIHSFSLNRQQDLVRLLQIHLPLSYSADKMRVDNLSVLCLVPGEL